MRWFDYPILLATGVGLAMAMANPGLWIVVVIAGALYGRLVIQPRLRAPKLRGDGDNDNEKRT